MSKASNRQGTIGALLFKWRWFFVTFIGAIVVLVEMQEHGTLAAAAMNPHLWREILLFGVLSPLAFGLIIEVLLRVQTERMRAIQELDQQHYLSQSLGQIQNWNELTRIIVEFPQRVLPVVAVSLRVYDPEHDRYELADFWALKGHEQALWKEDVDRDHCRRCKELPAAEARFLTPCLRMTDPQMPRRYTSYCLPLLRQDETLALLHLHFAGEPTLLSQQVKILVGMLPEMALALEGLRLQRMAISQKEATNAERQRIARELHDTLGQSLGYLRLKLDQLASGDALREISAIRGELERMREIADEAYLQVRSTLADLRPEKALDLNQALLDHLRQLSARSGLEVHFSVHGQPYLLPSHMKRQIVYIYREILNNIEKHAHARTVDVRLDWGESELRLEVADDGIGFDVQSLPFEGHYGLEIIRERAEDLKGTVEIDSAINSGTRVRLLVPYDCPPLNSSARLLSEVKN